MGTQGLAGQTVQRTTQRHAFTCSVSSLADAIEQTMPDDAELLYRYVTNRDQNAFAEIVRRHLDGVYSAALRRVGGDVQFAEDVTQQVFATLARKARAVSRHPCLGAWLYTTTRHESANLVRRERRRKARERCTSVMTLIAPDESSSADADWQQIAPILDEAIDRLAELDRTAIVLRYIERRGFAAVGAALHVSADAARMRVERALERLRHSLVRRGVTSSAMGLGIALAANAASPAPVAMGANITATALASVAITAGTAPWVTFMSLTKVQTTLAAAALLAAGAAFHSQHLATDERSRDAASQTVLTAASARRDALQREIRESTTRRTELEQQLGADRASRVHGNGSPAPITPIDSQLEILRRQARNRQDLARTHPEYQRLSREVARRDLWRQYGRLYLALNLSPKLVAQFEQIMVEYDWQRVDVESAARAQGLPDSASPIPKMLGDIESNRNAALRQLLGAERHAEYELFRHTAGIRFEITDWMAGALYETRAPLTGGQASRLTDILARHTIAGEGKPLSTSEIRWDNALVEARGVLSPIQMQFLESLRAQMDWRRAFHAAIGPVEEKPVDKRTNGG